MSDHIHDLLAVKGTTVHAVGREALVIDAVEKMNAEQIGALLVREPDGRIAGIFTERDVLRRVVASRRDPRAIAVEAVMTREVVTIDLGATVTSAMLLVTDRRCRHLPVVDGPRVCGLVSAGDLTSWLVRDQQRTIDHLYDYIQRT